MIGIIETRSERWDHRRCIQRWYRASQIMQGFGGYPKGLEIYPEHSGKCHEIIRFVLGRESRRIVGDKSEED